MTAGGWITMLLSVGTVCLLFFWCLYKVFSYNPPARDVADAAMHEGEED